MPAEMQQKYLARRLRGPLASHLESVATRDFALGQASGISSRSATDTIDEEASEGIALPTVEQANHFGLREAIRTIRLQEQEVELTGVAKWPESGWFQAITAFAIFVNALVIGIETDCPSGFVWWLEQSILVYFLWEIGIRIFVGRLLFFFGKDELFWNWFDTSIVLVGIVDQWVLPALGEEQGNNYIMIARMLRLLRAFRLFRLVRLVRPLHTLSQGILDAMHGMLWILVFMGMWMYSISILVTRLIGHGLLFYEDDYQQANTPEVLEVRKLFSTVGSSMFSLFELVSNWSLLHIQQILDMSPLLRLFFVAVVIYSTWAMLSVMTGVVSENMIAIRDQSEEEQRVVKEQVKLRLMRELEQIFREGDADHDGNIDYDEFNDLVHSKHVNDLMKATRVTLKDLLDMFTWLDHDCSRSVNIDEFLEAFRWAVEPVRGKSIFKLEQRIVGAIQSLGRNTEEVMTIRFDPIIRSMKKVAALAELFQTLRGSIAPKRQTYEEWTQLGSRLQACDGRLLEAQASLETILDDVRRIRACAGGALQTVSPPPPRNASARAPTATVAGAAVTRLTSMVRKPSK